MPPSLAVYACSAYAASARCFSHKAPIIDKIIVTVNFRRHAIGSPGDIFVKLVNINDFPRTDADRDARIPSSVRRRFAVLQNARWSTFVYDRPIVISRDGVSRTGMTYTRSRTRHVAAQVIPLVILRLVVSACYFPFLTHASGTFGMPLRTIQVRSDVSVNRSETRSICANRRSR